MIRSYLFSSFFFVFFILSSLQAVSQSADAEWQTHVEKLKAYYNNPETSPLDSVEMESFKGLQFFEYNPSARQEVKIKKLKSQEVQEFATSTDRIAKYRPYALITFKMGGKKHKLTVYRPASPKPGDDHLFLPFTDETTGTQSYGAGRYIDLRLSDLVGKRGTVDFNFCYHPYCAYSHHYSCPIAPQCNSLSVAMLAGVKL